MPLLPPKNTLDFNPDSVFNASKKIRTIQLEQMKNPTYDPDQAVLSLMEARKKLDETFNNLEGLAGTYNDLVVRIANYLAIAEGRVGRKLAKAEAKELKKSSGKKSSGRRRNIPIEGDEADIDSLASRLAQDRTRFTPYYRDDDRNSVAYNTQIDSEPDFGRVFPLPTTRSPAYPIRRPTRRPPPTPRQETPPPPFEPIPPNAFEYLQDYESEGSGRKKGKGRMLKGGANGVEPLSAFEAEVRLAEEEKNVSLVGMFLGLIQITRKIDILLNSRVKPVISSLTPVMIKTLVDLQNLIEGSGNRIVKPIKTRPMMEAFEGALLNAEGEYEDSIMSLWISENDKLLLDITIIINAYGREITMGAPAVPDVPENAPAVAEAEGAGRFPVRLVGSGRNFYGEMINETRDIPTIRMSYRDCPTKYLL